MLLRWPGPYTARVPQRPLEFRPGSRACSASTGLARAVDAWLPGFLVHASCGCLLLLAGGCSAKVDPSYDDPTPAARLAAIRQTSAEGRTTDIPSLIENLASDDPVVRMAAIGALQRLTGTTLGYRFDDTFTQRQKSIEEWKVWLQAHP